MVYIRPFSDLCPLCGADCESIRPVCPACASRLPLNRTCCRICALPLAHSGVCGECLREPPPFSRVHAPLRYAWPVDALINSLKHRSHLPAARLLGALFLATLESRPGPGVLVPVPLHAARLRERGFNQAGELAAGLARGLGLGCARRLVRRAGPESHQQGAGRKRRRANVRGAFSLRGRAPGHVLIVDDVVTTGATVREIARLLRAAGTREVEVLALARTARGD